MACILACAAEAIVATVARKSLEAKAETAEKTAEGEVRHLSFAKKLKWLSNMLWGGTVLLALEHVWHGEITPWFPFLTAMSDPTDKAVMLHEIATVGVGMCVAITAVWAVMVLVSNAMEKKALSAQTQE
jgi:hypothetical protein